MDNFSLFDADAPEAGDDYRAFLDKFKTRKTTDDVYTPDNVMAAVESFVRRTYRLEGAQLLRPFFPGGDFEHFRYPEGAVVCDNPPFSILSRIIGFYHERQGPFFLFAPALTLFSASAAQCTALPVGVTVTFVGGAEISVSFVTNLEEPDLAVKSYPELYRAIDEANRANLAAGKKHQPKYEYPDHVVTAAMVQRWCRYGVEYELRRGDCVRVGGLDSQKSAGKSIFGGGLLLSTSAAAERAAAERAAAERAAAERAAALRWPLSVRERGIIETMDGAQTGHR